MVTSCSGCITPGSARKTRLSIKEKIAVLAPIPNARDRIATVVTSGVERSERKARRKSREKASMRRHAEYFAILLFESFNSPELQNRLSAGLAG
jgi:hypothetical protein